MQNLGVKQDLNALLGVLRDSGKGVEIKDRSVVLLVDVPCVFAIERNTCSVLASPPTVMLTRHVACGRRWVITSYRKCFVGAEFVSWLISNGVVPREDVGCQFGTHLIELGLIKPLTGLAVHSTRVAGLGLVHPCHPFRCMICCRRLPSRYEERGSVLPVGAVLPALLPACRA